MSIISVSTLVSGLIYLEAEGSRIGLMSEGWGRAPGRPRGLRGEFINGYLVLVRLYSLTYIHNAILPGLPDLVHQPVRVSQPAGT